MQKNMNAVGIGDFAFNLAGSFDAIKSYVFKGIQFCKNYLKLKILRCNRFDRWPTISTRAAPICFYELIERKVEARTRLSFFGQD
jgi:hypothetical protein